jgi:hypothetical protein
LNNHKCHRHNPDGEVVGAYDAFRRVDFYFYCGVAQGGCAVFEKETTNRGGYFDYLLDEH